MRQCFRPVRLINADGSNHLDSRDCGPKLFENLDGLLDLVTKTHDADEALI